MKKSVISFLLASLFLVPLAEAKRDSRRENRQQNRIDQGAQSGELTKHESRRLHRGQKHVDAAQDRAMADGQMTAGEKLRIEKMQDRQNRKIYRQKHDGQNRDTQTPPPAATAPTE